jgi:hypothetical protein
MQHAARGAREVRMEHVGSEGKHFALFPYYGPRQCTKGLCREQNEESQECEPVKGSSAASMFL